MSEFLRSFTGRTIDDIPLAEYLAGTSNTATFKTTVSGQTAFIKLFVIDFGRGDAQLGHLQLTEKLVHPHLLRTIRTGRAEVDGTQVVYVVTEYAEENLAQVLPERALTPQETREVIESTVDALAYLHEQGLVHGDLKAANIMAIGDQLKLSVDGVQRSGEALNREPGAHDAPETAQKVSPASDIWSLGVTLVEVLTQQLPAKPDSAASGASVPETVPAPFREIAQHCLLRTPELRWSIREIRAKLNPPKAELVRPAAPMTTEAPRVPPPAAHATSKRPFFLLAVVAAIVVVIVLISRMSEHKAAPPIPTQTESQVQPAPATEGATSDTTSNEEKPSEEQSGAPAERSGDAVSTKKRANEEPAGEAKEDTEAEAASAPGVTRQVMPRVIPQARKSIQGKIRVKLKVKVDASGNVVDSSFVSRGPSSYFAKAAEDAARQWKFEPSSSEVRSWNVEFAFKRSGTQVRAAQGR